MKSKSGEHRLARIRRHRRVRKKILGTAERPRLNVFRSNSHIYAQIIDDTQHKTLVSASTLTKEFKARVEDKKTKVEQSKIVGALIAEKAKEAGIEQVVFDRGGYLYHGRVKALAEAAREKGLKF